MTALVMSHAPVFKAKAVMPDNSIRDEFSLADLRGRYVVLFFYPYDFSFVCPSELRALDSRIEEFRERECEIVGVSVDSHFTHLAWKKTAVENGGIGPLRFPLVADVTKQVCRDYGILADDGAALRATFLIDGGGIVRYQVINDPDVGRNIGDTLRTLDALRLVERTGKVCPADWKEGDEAMEATPAGVIRYHIDFRSRS